MNFNRCTQIVCIIFITVLSGCMSVPTDRLAAFHEVKPRSILVVPVVNKSVDVMASTSVLTTLPKQLAEKGYYVFPVNTVKTLLEYEGFADEQEIHSLPPTQLATLFHADSILYVTINEWTSKYLVLITQTEVDFDYRIVAADGTLLWSEHQHLVYSPKSESSGNPFTDLIVSAVNSAVERAAPNYLPLTRQANSNVFWNEYIVFPPGPYLPSYEEYYETVN